MEGKLRCDALRQSLAAAEEGIAAAEARLQQLQEAVEAHERRLAARSQVRWSVLYFVATSAVPTDL